MIVRKWIRTNLRPSVASVGLSFLGITLWNIPPHDLSGHGTEEHVAGRVEEHDVDDLKLDPPLFQYSQEETVVKGDQDLRITLPRRLMSAMLRKLEGNDMSHVM